MAAEGVSFLKTWALSLYASLTTPGPDLRELRMQYPGPGTPLMGLPEEIQLLIFSMCRFVDLRALRRVNKQFYRMLPFWQIKLFFSPDELRLAMLRTCLCCEIESPPNENFKVWDDEDEDDIKYPVRRCYACHAATVGFTPRQRVVDLDNRSHFVCVWCGYPVYNPTLNSMLHPDPCTNHYFNFRHSNSFFNVLEAVYSVSALWLAYTREILPPDTSTTSYSLGSPLDARISSLLATGLVFKILANMDNLNSVRRRSGGGRIICPHGDYIMVFIFHWCRFACNALAAKRASDRRNMYPGSSIVDIGLTDNIMLTNAICPGLCAAGSALLLLKYRYWTFARMDLYPWSWQIKFHETMTFLCLRANLFCQELAYEPYAGETTPYPRSVRALLKLNPVGASRELCAVSWNFLRKAKVNTEKSLEELKVVVAEFVLTTALGIYNVGV